MSDFSQVANQSTSSNNFDRLEFLFPLVSASYWEFIIQFVESLETDEIHSIIAVYYIRNILFAPITRVFWMNISQTKVKTTFFNLKNLTA